MIERHGCCYDASSGTGEFDISEAEEKILNELLSATRSTMYQLVNEVMEEGAGEYKKWKKNRWAVIQNLAHIEKEMSAALEKVKHTWFNDKKPVIEKDGVCSRFSNYYSNGEPFDGTVFYESET